MEKKGPAPKLKFTIIAADVAIFSWRDDELVVRLMNVDRPPYFVHVPGLPGGLIHPDETAEQTAARLVRERGGVDTKHVHIEQLRTYSRIDRDPRGRVVSVAHMAVVPWASLSQHEKSGSPALRWESVQKALKLPLAYDHREVLKDAMLHLAERMRYTTMARNLLPQALTLFDLQSLYETVLKMKLDKRNFRKKVLSLNILKPLGRKETGRKVRPAELYAFVSKKLEFYSIV